MIHWWRRHPYDPSKAFDVAEEFSGPPSGGQASRWTCGVGAAVIVIAYGLRCVVSGRAELVIPRGLQILHLEGAEAVSLGITYIWLALFLHCHYFWGAHPAYWGYAQIAKIVSLIGLVGALGFAIWHFVLFT